VSSRVRWAGGLALAAVVAVAGVASLLVGLAVGLARDSAGAELTAQADATVLAMADTDDGATLRVRFAPAPGTSLETDVTWTATDAPRPGDRLTVAYDPGDPSLARPYADIDPTGGWAAEWHPAPWIAGGVIGGLAAVGIVVVTARWASRAARRSRDRPRRRP
jgi:hypothetical protein